MRSKRRPLTVDGRTYTVTVCDDGSLYAVDTADRPVAHGGTRGALVAQLRGQS